uniref:NudC domain containing 3 n=1 Tax=Dromaius novaehollandiae TaxID=8790 RepID=A0A8C4KGJ6_DRONO
MEAAAALTDMYDQALLGILQHVGNVEEFLRVLFGFLYRKTDFYRLLLRPSDRLGFPPGAAQAMALQAFKVFERMARQDDEKRRRELEAKLRKKEEEEEAAERAKASPAAQEIEMESTAERVPAPDAEGAAGPREPAAAQDAAPAAPGSSAEPPQAAAPAEPRPEPPTRQEQFQTNPDSYNGAVRENYAWSQDYSDLEIKVPVPKHIVKGKQVNRLRRSGFRGLLFPLRAPAFPGSCSEPEAAAGGGWFGDGDAFPRAALCLGERLSPFRCSGNGCDGFSGPRELGELGELEQALSRTRPAPHRCSEKEDAGPSALAAARRDGAALLPSAAEAGSFLRSYPHALLFLCRSHSLLSLLPGGASRAGATALASHGRRGKLQSSQRLAFARSLPAKPVFRRYFSVREAPAPAQPTPQRAKSV